MRGSKYRISVYLCWEGDPGIVLVVVGLRSLALAEVALGMNTVENKQSSTTTDARIQVPFSRISVVCLTPINWLLNPATFPASPPPFGF